MSARIGARSSAARQARLVLTAAAVLACAGGGIASCGKSPTVLIRASRTQPIGDGWLVVSLNGQPVDTIKGLPVSPSSVGLGYQIHPEDAKVTTVLLKFTPPNSTSSVLDMTELPWTGQTITWVAGGLKVGAGGHSGTAGTGAGTGGLAGAGGQGGSGTAGGGTSGGVAGGGGSTTTGGMNGQAGTPGPGSGGAPASGGMGAGLGGNGSGGGGAGGRPTASGGITMMGTGGAGGRDAGSGGATPSGGAGGSGGIVPTGGTMGSGGVPPGSGGMGATGGAQTGGRGGSGTGGAGGRGVTGTGGQGGGGQGAAGGAGGAAAPTCFTSATVACTCADYCARLAGQCGPGLLGPDWMFFPAGWSDCEATCRSFNWGEATLATLDNQLSCRSRRVATMQCAQAGPTGGGSCGSSRCNVLCKAVADNCQATNPYPSNDCLTVCTTKPYTYESGERLLTMSTITEDGDFNCRLYWAARAGRPELSSEERATACANAGENSVMCP